MFKKKWHLLDIYDYRKLLKQTKKSLYNKKKVAQCHVKDWMFEFINDEIDIY